MAYPTSVTDFPTIDCNTVTNPSDIVNAIQVDLEAVETKLGTGASTATNNMLLRGTGAGSSAWDKAAPTGDIVGTTDTQTLTNKTLTLPKINENVETTSTSTELNYNDGVTPGTAVASKTVVLDANKDFNFGTGDITATIGRFTAAKGGFRDGFVVNYKLDVSVASDDLTVAIKTLAGTDPSATDPIFATIGGTQYEITSALSLTANDVASFNASSSELAGKNMNYFAYLIATGGVPYLAIARIPYGRTYADFSGTLNNEKHLMVSGGSPSATDPVINIGRLNATLSSGNDWTVPGLLIINQPTFQSSIKTWQPSYSASGSMTWTSVATDQADYQIIDNFCEIAVGFNGTAGGTASNQLYFTVPFTSAVSSNAYGTVTFALNNGSFVQGRIYPNTTSQFRIVRFDLSNFTLAAGAGGVGVFRYPIAL